LFYHILTFTAVVYHIRRASQQIYNGSYSYGTNCPMNTLNPGRYFPLSIFLSCISKATKNRFESGWLFYC